MAKLQTFPKASDPFRERDLDHSGLDFAYGEGRVCDEGAITEVSAGSVTLADDSTNYVEVDVTAGTVSANTTAFSGGYQFPLFIVVTSSGAIDSVTDKRSFFVTNSGDLVAHKGYNVPDDNVHNIRTTLSKQQFVNLLRNADFDIWPSGDSSAPKYFSLSSVTISRITTNATVGGNVAKITSNGASTALGQGASSIGSDIVEFLGGKPVTLICRCRALAANDQGAAYIKIEDGSGEVRTQVPADDTFAVRTVTRSSIDAASLNVQFTPNDSTTSDTDDVLEVDWAMFICGELPVGFIHNPLDMLDKHDDYIRLMGYGESTNGTDDYTISPYPAPASYEAGQVFNVKVDVANTGACTLNVSSLGAVSIKTENGYDPPDGFIPAGALITLIHDGTNFCIIGSGATDILTTKGDILTFGAGETRLGVGADGEVLTADSAIAKGIKWGAQKGNYRGVSFYIHGDLAVEALASMLIIPASLGLTISNVTAYVDTAPSGADLIIDINKNGTTIFSTQTNRPTITDGTNSTTSVTPGITSLAGGDRVSIDIDQVGSSTAGSKLAVTLNCVVA